MELKIDERYYLLSHWSDGLLAMDLLQTSQVVELLNDTDTNWCVDFIRLSFTSWKTMV